MLYPAPARAALVLAGRMRGAADVWALARRALSAQAGSGAPPSSQLSQHKLNLTVAERAAGTNARADAEDRAAEYTRRKLLKQQPAAAPEPFISPAGALAPLDDGDGRRAFLAEPPPEGGLAGIAERQIQAAQRQGTFDNLRLRGAALEEILDPHDATHFSSGDAMAARVLKAANYRRDALAKLQCMVSALTRCCVRAGLRAWSCAQSSTRRDASLSQSWKPRRALRCARTAMGTPLQRRCAATRGCVASGRL